jgi:hypothetical protein
MLAHQVEQRRFEGRDRVDRGAQVEGLQAAPAAVAGVEEALIAGGAVNRQ